VDSLFLITFLGEEVYGALTTHKIRGEAASRCGYTSSAATGTLLSDLRVSRPLSPGLQKVRDVGDRIDKLKKANYCFLCKNRGHIFSNCIKKGNLQGVKCREPHHQYLCDEGSSNTSPVATSSIKSVGKIRHLHPRHHLPRDGAVVDHVNHETEPANSLRA
jgi:hypothetical protein